MRPLIQYDLDEHPTVPVVPSPHPLSPWRPPVKKRKRNSQPAQPQKTPLQHWDDPGGATVGMLYDEQDENSAASPAPLDLVAGSVSKVSAYVDDVEEEEEEAIDVEGEEEEEESRPLTHEEIWDDTALIDAWRSAEAEYEAYHGTSKAWKTEPVKKSSLWCNKPYTATTPRKPNARPDNISPQEYEDGEPEPDTAPLDFDTYVPTHDPSLAIDDATANPTTTTNPSFVPPPSATMVTRDEAFNNALSAMYWSGYWTAVHHCQSQSSEKNNNGPTEAIEENGIETDEDEEVLVPAQR